MLKNPVVPLNVLSPQKMLKMHEKLIQLEMEVDLMNVMQLRKKMMRGIIMVYHNPPIPPSLCAAQGGRRWNVEDLGGKE